MYVTLVWSSYVLFVCGSSVWFLRDNYVLFVCRIEWQIRVEPLQLFVRAVQQKCEGML